MTMATEFKDTVRARAKRDPAFREALLKEAIELLRTGDLQVGKAVLGDYIEATKR